MEGRKRIFFAAFAALFLMGATCARAPERMGTVMPEGREWFEAGERAFSAANYEEALQHYAKLMEQYPASALAARAEFRSGQCYYLLGRHEQAAEFFRRFIARHNDSSELVQAQDYLIRIQEAELAQLREEKRTKLAGLEERLYRLEAVNQSLRRSVDAEVIYLEMNLEADRLYVKMGTQILYEYPIVSGKGATRLKLTGEITQFDTPRGIRRIENIEKDPVWYRPDWYWTEKGLPVPENLTMKERAVPGALGPYKLSFGEGFFIHGTRTGKIDPGKFSHGCVRMNNKDLLQLVNLVEVGTMIYIY